jgi:hypothetical protein
MAPGPGPGPEPPVAPIGHALVFPGRGPGSRNTTIEEVGVYNTLDVASYTTRAYVCGPVNIANDVLEMLSKCNNVLVHAIAMFFDLIGNEWELTMEWFPMHCGRPHIG